MWLLVPGIAISRTHTVRQITHKYAVIQAPGSRFPPRCQHLDLNGRALVVRLIPTSALVERHDKSPGEGAKGDPGQTGGGVDRHILRMPHDLEIDQASQAAGSDDDDCMHVPSVQWIFFGGGGRVTTHRPTVIKVP